MTRYSVQPRDRLFLKGYGFLSFAKNMSKNIDANISTAWNVLIMLENLQQMHLKLLQKEQFKKYT